MDDVRANPDADQDPSGLRQRTIPVLRQPCELPMRIAMLTYADSDRQAGREAEFAKIVPDRQDAVAAPAGRSHSGTPASDSTPPKFDTAVVRKLRWKRSVMTS